MSATCQTEISFVVGLCFYYFALLLQSVDENELDIPNGENNAENEEEQEQTEVDEQDFYVEGLLLYPLLFLYFFAKCVSLAWKLVEENVYLKPIDGPSNGQREEKEEEKKPQEDEASGSEGND